jgi:hypothetical protein
MILRVFATFVAFFLSTVGTAQAACNVTKAARQVVKSLVAVEDLRGVTGYQGGVEGQDEISTTVIIEALHQAENDRYKIKIRNQDCRTLSAELVGEGIPH